jgi:S-adenosylmethionine:tRNA-ribosyltransferase-isomerase (queuine synthetase)
MIASASVASLRRLFRSVGMLYSHRRNTQSDSFVRSGFGLATQRIGTDTPLRVVDAILSGTHEPGTSHYHLLRAFVDDATLRGLDRELNLHNYRTHEFGDSIFVERNGRGAESLEQQFPAE